MKTKLTKGFLYLNGKKIGKIENYSSSVEFNPPLSCINESFNVSKKVYTIELDFKQIKDNKFISWVKSWLN